LLEKSAKKSAAGGLCRENDPKLRAPTDGTCAALEGVLVNDPSYNPYAAPNAPPPYYPPAFAQPMERPIPADIGARLVATIIDNVVVVGPMLCALLIMAVLQDGSSNGGDLVIFVVMGALLLGLAVQLVHQARTMQSVGKRILGIRVVCLDGSTPSLVRIVVLRNLSMHAIGAFCGLVGLVDALMIFGTERRCMHDHIAGTIVVRAVKS
jgi:uncharacterized RDD family membrane protein YckC